MQSFQHVSKSRLELTISYNERRIQYTRIDASYIFIFYSHIFYLSVKIKRHI